MNLPPFNAAILAKLQAAAAARNLVVDLTPDGLRKASEQNNTNVLFLLVDVLGTELATLLNHEQRITTLEGKVG